MFDFVREKKRLVQIVLAMILLPFAFWGVDSYRKVGDGDYLAKVNGEKISQQEFDNVLQQQKQRMQEMSGGRMNAAVFDQPEVKLSVLENMVAQRLLAESARSTGLGVSNEQLQAVIAGIDAFQDGGKFDQKKYESLLSAQGMTPLIFEGKVRQELSTRQLTDAYTQNGYASNTTTGNLVRLYEQQRVVSLAQSQAASFLPEVKIDDAAIKAYYDKNTQQFEVPEQVRAEYVVLSADGLQPGIKIDSAEVRKYYEEHQADFGSPEMRQAAHILIAVPAQASAAEKDAARAHAEEVLKQVKEASGKFAELAQQYSQDPGSAANGGNLGAFGRGMMVKPFEDAVFSMQPGQVSDLVQSDFGFHIIKLMAVKPSKIASFDEVKFNIEQKLREQKASDKFAELAEKFSNIVYEQSDTLKPAAELAGMPIQQSVWLSKGQQPGAVAPWNEKALQAIFSDDVLKDKRNTLAIEIAPNVLLAARMLEHKPASTRPLAEVTGDIRIQLANQRAQEMAVKQGQDWLNKATHGESLNVSWSQPANVMRNVHPGLSEEMARQVYQANAGKLPAYVGGEVPGGYLVVRVDAVNDPAPADEQKLSRYLQQLKQLTGEEMLQAYLRDLRKSADVKLKAFAEEKK